MPLNKRHKRIRAARGASYLTQEEFERMGAEALGGTGWKSRLCAINGVQKSSLTRWASGETPIPKWLAVQLVLMRRFRIDELMSLANTLPVEEAVPRGALATRASGNNAGE